MKTLLIPLFSFKIACNFVDIESLGLKQGRLVKLREAFVSATQEKSRKFFDVAVKLNVTDQIPLVRISLHFLRVRLSSSLAM